MADLQIDDILLVRIGTYTPKQAGINTIYYGVLNMTGSSTIQNLADELGGDFETPYRNLIGVTARYRGVSVSRIDGGDPTQPFINTAFDGPGINGNVLMPQQASGLISFKTNRIGPRGRGRIYVPFPPSLFNDDPGVPNDTYMDNLDVLKAQIGPSKVVDRGGGNTITLAQLIWHRADSTFTFVSEIVPRKAWATQRKRGDYGRINPIPF